MALLFTRDVIYYFGGQPKHLFPTFHLSFVQLAQKVQLNACYISLCQVTKNYFKLLTKSIGLEVFFSQKFVID